jgi:ribonuclease Z
MFGNPDDVFSIGELQLRTCLADHDMMCLAFRFDLHRAAAFQPERAKAIGVPIQQWKLLQRGQPVEFNGRIVQPDEVLGPPRPGLALGFVTDSRPTQKLVEFFTDVDLLITEATYGDPADQPKAVENKHMTFAEAAAMGAAARAKKLWFTHFTPAMPNPDYFRKEAEAVYPGVVIGHERLSTTLSFVD